MERRERLCMCDVEPSERDRNAKIWGKRSKRKEREE